MAGALGGFSSFFVRRMDGTNLVNTTSILCMMPYETRVTRVAYPFAVEITIYS
jgi:hypothetical protein